MPKNNDSVDNATLDAPLTLQADQLELVAGGMAAAIKPGLIGPTNGLWQLTKVDFATPIAMTARVVTI